MCLDYISLWTALSTVLDSSRHDTMDRESEIKASRPTDTGFDLEKTEGKAKEVQGDSHFHETVTAAPLDPWSRTSLQLYAILLVASLNATASGFDGVSDPE